ncbi:MAG: hypothetical protein EPO26_17300 [Chloroflexota bacterium]|nr:MAG: hypothetical protein EPO26_17300 [Chloroflexota bacterium]
MAGTGLEVWDVIRSYRDLNEEWEQLRAAFASLSETQLRAAIAYSRAYPEYIDRCRRRDERHTAERLWRENPSTRPPWR